MSYQRSAIYDGQQQYDQQQQHFQQEQEQDQVNFQELKFAVYQDLQNTINIFYYLIGVMEYFQDDPNHPMITTATNKLIAQLNLSNSIHYDQQSNSQVNDFLHHNLKMLNGKASQIFNQLIASQNLPQSFSQYVNFYRDNLSSYIHLQTLQLKPTNSNPQFNQNVVQRLFDAMITTDEVYKNIHQGKRVQSPTKNSIERTALDYKRLTLQRLQANFPKVQDTYNNYPSTSRFQQKSPQAKSTVVKLTLREQLMLQNQQQEQQQQEQQQQQQLQQQQQQQQYQKQQQKQQQSQCFQQRSNQQYSNSQSFQQFPQLQQNEQHQDATFLRQLQSQQQQKIYQYPSGIIEKKDFKFFADTQLQQRSQPSYYNNYK